MDPNQQPQDPANPSQPAQPQFGAPEPDTSQPQAFGQSTEVGQAPVPQPTYPSPTPVGPQQPVSGENPGQLFGILSIVLTFLGISIVGIVLGVISRKKSKEVGASTTLGTIGLVFGIVTTVLGALVFIGILVSIVLVGTNNVQDKAETSSTSEAAKQLMRYGELYNADNGKYATSVSELDTSSLSEEATLVDTTPTAAGELQYVQCDDESAQVLYYDSNKASLGIEPLGTASAIIPC